MDLRLIALIAALLIACNDAPAGPARVHGFVAKGTVVKAIVADESLSGFALELDGRRTWVILRGPAPDNLKDGTELRASGKLVAPTALSAELRALGLDVEADQKVLDAATVEGGCEFLISKETADRAPAWCRR
jgi:hypothetical protein